MADNDTVTDNEAVTDNELDQWLNRAFRALGDPTRRALVTHLSDGEATVNELAEPFSITKQAVSRHLHSLAAAELITRGRDAQRRPCRLNPAALARLSGWINAHRRATRSCIRKFDPATETTKEKEL